MVGFHGKENVRSEHDQFGKGKKCIYYIFGGSFISCSGVGTSCRGDSRAGDDGIS